MEYRKDPHRVYSLTYHLIFVVKYRQSVFLEEIGIIKALKTKIFVNTQNSVIINSSYNKNLVTQLELT